MREISKLERRLQAPRKLAGHATCPDILTTKNLSKRFLAGHGTLARGREDDEGLACGRKPTGETGKEKKKLGTIYGRGKRKLL